MVGLSRLAGGGLLPLLLLALLPLALDGKPAPVPQALPEAPAGGTTAWRRDLTEQQPPPAEESSGPAAGRSGSKAGQAAPTPPKGKGAAVSAAASRLLRDLRRDVKESRPTSGRLAYPEYPAGGGGGGGGGGQSRDTWGRLAYPEYPAGGGGGGGAWRRAKRPPKKGRTFKSCFGLPLDRIGTKSGLGC
uniref:NP-Sut-1 n=1 Tax=Suta fasciata TaxID=529716 RepID=R4G7L3_9SAUR